MAHTISVDVERPLEWWRPLVQWFLCIPHLLLTGALAGASVVVALVMGLMVLVTGRVPSRLAAFQVFTLRERVRCYSHFFLLRRTTPPYPREITTVDPGDDPLTIVSIDPPTAAPRWSILRVFTLIGHLVVLIPIGAVMDTCYVLWAGIAAANRGWPPGFERLLVGVERWVVAVAMYLLLVTNDAPRFGLAAHIEGLPATAPASS